VDLALDYLEHAPAEQFSGEEAVAVADAGDCRVVNSVLLILFWVFFPVLSNSHCRP